MVFRNCFPLVLGVKNPSNTLEQKAGQHVEVSLHREPVWQHKGFFCPIYLCVLAALVGVGGRARTFPNFLGGVLKIWASAEEKRQVIFENVVETGDVWVWAGCLPVFFQPRKWQVLSVLGVFVHNPTLQILLIFWLSPLFNEHFVFFGWIRRGYLKREQAFWTLASEKDPPEPRNVLFFFFQHSSEHLTTFDISPAWNPVTSKSFDIGYFRSVGIEAL